MNPPRPSMSRWATVVVHLTNRWVGSPAAVPASLYVIFSALRVVVPALGSRPATEVTRAPALPAHSTRVSHSAEISSGERGISRSRVLPRRSQAPPANRRAVRPSARILVGATATSDDAPTRPAVAIPTLAARGRASG